MRLTLPETKLHGAPIVTPRPAVRIPVVLRDTEHVTTSKKTPPLLRAVGFEGSLNPQLAKPAWDLEFY